MSMCLRTEAAAAVQGPSCVSWLEFQSITLTDTSQQRCVSVWRLSKRIAAADSE